MALTALQRDVCRLLAAERRRSGESYVAGGVALSVALATSRLSRDVDVFHDTEEAVARSWDRDRAALEQAGFAVRVVRERPGYVEAAVSREGDGLVMEWARDSAFRFFPLVEDDELGLVLHPFDLASNKVLALVGRAEARDWIDVIACHERLQPLGYLAWAACGKDPGFTPSGILDQAGRSARYTDDEIASLAFEGATPAAADLSRRWHGALEGARHVVDRLPAEQLGKAVMTIEGMLFIGTAAELERAVGDNRLFFHRGSIGGAWPHVRDRAGH
jgi:hypothetical protein